MRIQRVKSEGIAALSYFVSSSDEAMVIDPRRDASIYKKLARREEVEISYILETHRNEDFVTGSIELESRTSGARIGHSDQTNFDFGEGLSDEETLIIGNMEVLCLQTPGHTNDSMCYIVSDRVVGSDPIVAFTGDTLFVNEVGRTDLVGMKKHEQMSRKLFNSLHKRVLTLGDGVIIHPAHGAGSVCGGNIGEREFSTIGYEKANNSWLKMNEDEFVKSQLDQRLTLATYFKHCEHLNTVGPPIIANLLVPKELDIDSFSELLEEDNHRAIDTRPSVEFLECHIPGSISLSLSKMGLLAGWALRPDQSFSIILKDEKREFAEASVMLYRIGYDNIVGYLKNGLEQWISSGRNTEIIPELTLDEFGAKQTRREVVVMDVREPHEFDKERIEDSISSPLTTLNETKNESVPTAPIVTICQHGFRATTAASILKRHGTHNVSVVLGGFESWRAHDYPVVQGK